MNTNVVTLPQRPTTPVPAPVFLARIDLGKWTAYAVGGTADEAVDAAVERAARFLPADPETITEEYGVAVEVLTMGVGIIG